MVEELNPTPQQRQEIESHRSQNFEKAKELRRQLQETGKQLKEELDKPVSDIAKVNALAAQIKALEASKVDERIQKVLELKKILTPQQYQLLQEKIKENRAKHPRPMKD
jgi:Spy/CpxP family protein refolding chaperone